MRQKKPRRVRRQRKNISFMNMLIGLLRVHNYTILSDGEISRLGFSGFALSHHSSTALAETSRTFFERNRSSTIWWVDDQNILSVQIKCVCKVMELIFSNIYTVYLLSKPRYFLVFPCSSPHKYSQCLRFLSVETLHSIQFQFALQIKRI